MFQLICTILQVLVKLKKEKNQGNNKLKKKERNLKKISMIDYDSESTVIISDNDMPPLPSVQASTHSFCYLVRENAGVDGFNAAMQKMRNEFSPPHE